MAVCIPVTVVPTSFATVAIDTFMTELSRVMRNCAEARVSRTSPVPFAAVASGFCWVTISCSPYMLIFLQVRFLPRYQMIASFSTICILACSKKGVCGVLQKRQQYSKLDAMLRHQSRPPTTLARLELRTQDGCKEDLRSAAMQGSTYCQAACKEKDI